jgi:hypothetical protein
VTSTRGHSTATWSPDRTQAHRHRRLSVGIELLLQLFERLLARSATQLAQ